MNSLVKQLPTLILTEEGVEWAHIHPSRRAVIFDFTGYERDTITIDGQPWTFYRLSSPSAEQLEMVRECYEVAPILKCAYFIGGPAHGRLLPTNAMERFLGAINGTNQFELLLPLHDDSSGVAFYSGSSTILDGAIVEFYKTGDVAYDVAAKQVHELYGRYNLPD